MMNKMLSIIIHTWHDVIIINTGTRMSNRSVINIGLLYIVILAFI